MVLDRDGNLLLAGSFTGTANLATTGAALNLTSGGDEDGFIMKVTAAGDRRRDRTLFVLFQKSPTERVPWAFYVVVGSSKRLGSQLASGSVSSQPDSSREG